MALPLLYACCAGLDVHKKSITACRMIPAPTGHEAEGIMELRTFGTMTRDLLALTTTEAPRGVNTWEFMDAVAAKLQEAVK